MGELRQMPKLMVFAPCEKVIVDSNTGTPSLISLLNTISTIAKAGVEIPSDGAVFRTWDTFTLWWPMPEDRDKQIRQITQIILPDGKVFLAQYNDFVLENRLHYNVTHWFVFPSLEGVYSITMWLENPTGDAITEKFVFPVHLTRRWLPVDPAPSGDEAK